MGGPSSSEKRTTPHSIYGKYHIETATIITKRLKFVTVSRNIQYKGGHWKTNSGVGSLAARRFKFTESLRKVE